MFSMNDSPIAPNLCLEMQVLVFLLHFFTVNTFRSHRISKSLLLFGPKPESELQISSDSEIPGCRQILLNILYVGMESETIFPENSFAC